MYIYIYIYKEHGFTSGLLEQAGSTSKRNIQGWFVHMKTVADMTSAMENIDWRFGGTSSSWELVNPRSLRNVEDWPELDILAGHHLDPGDLAGTVYNNYLGYLLNGAGARLSCAQVPLESCLVEGAEQTVVFRQLCPRHCGCASPTSGTVAITLPGGEARVFWRVWTMGINFC